MSETLNVIHNDTTSSESYATMDDAMAAAIGYARESGLTMSIDASDASGSVGDYFHAGEAVGFWSIG